MRRALPSLLLSLLALVGCGPTIMHVKYNPRPRITSVVSLSPSTTELIGSNGSFQLLKGRMAADNFPTMIAQVPIVGSLKPDYELIKQKNPDLILYDDALYNPQDVEKIKSLGFKTFALTGNTVADYEASVFDLANRIGNETTFADYIDRVKSAVNQAAGDKPQTPPKVAVIMPGGGGADYIVGTKSFLANAITLVGGTPVGPDGDKFVTLNPEMLVSSNPDMIFVPSTPAKAVQDVNAVRSDPRFKSVKAVQAGQIVPIDQDVMLRRGSRVDKLIQSFHRAVTKGQS